MESVPLSTWLQAPRQPEPMQDSDQRQQPEDARDDEEDTERQVFANPSKSQEIARKPWGAIET